MKYNINSKSRLFSAFAVIAFLAMPSFCHSWFDIESEKAKAESSVFETEPLCVIAGTTDNLLNDTITGTPEEKIIKSNSDPVNEDNKIKSIDSTKYNMFGDLLDDDPFYNEKKPLWIPIYEVPFANVTLWAIDNFILNADYSIVGFNSWSHNIKTGWEWDVDRFGMNFLAHPYSGGLNFTSARSNGYNFWESFPFALGGSLMWEYFGENTLPSYNDLINTPVSGAFYGEILYRLGSNLLDDRTTGTERFLREFGAALLSPKRFFHRLLQGDLARVTTEEIYQKEPLNIELSVGDRRLNKGSDFWTGPQNLTLNAQFDYGYPFEKRQWKPFDYFKIRAGLNIGVGRKIIENVTGYGVLFGKNLQYGDLEMLLGIFQHYNYFDNNAFELGTIAFGGGIMSKLTISKEKFIFTNFHLCVVPLAGNSTHFGPDVSQTRDYNYGGGVESRVECGLNLGWGAIQLIGYYFWIKTYVGFSEDNLIGIFRPRITFKIYRNLHIGFEQLVYYSDRYTVDFGDFHDVRSEQRIYLMVNVGNFKL